MRNTLSPTFKFLTRKTILLTTTLFLAILEVNCKQDPKYCIQVTTTSGVSPDKLSKTISQRFTNLGYKILKSDKEGSTLNFHITTADTLKEALILEALRVKGEIKIKDTDSESILKLEKSLVAFKDSFPESLPGEIIRQGILLITEDTASVNRRLKRYLVHHSDFDSIGFLWGASEKTVLAGQEIRLKNSLRKNGIPLYKSVPAFALYIYPKNGKEINLSDKIDKTEIEFFGPRNLEELVILLKKDFWPQWEKYTSETTGHTVMVIIDGFVYSAPRVNAAIPSGVLTTNFENDKKGLKIYKSALGTEYLPPGSVKKVIIKEE